MYTKDIDYHKHEDKVKEDYIDIYESLQVGLNHVGTSDGTPDIATTYIGKKTIERKTFKAEASFPMTEQGMTFRQTFG